MTAFNNLLEEVFENLNNLDPVRVGQLVNETALLMENLQKMALSPDPKVREEAKKVALDAKRSVELQLDRLAEVSGINPDELMRMAEDPQFKIEAAKELERLEGELAQPRLSKVDAKNIKIKIH